MKAQDQRKKTSTGASTIMSLFLLFLLVACAKMLRVDALPSTLFPESLENEVITSTNFTLVPRSGWHARLPKETKPLHTPVPYVVIHHSYRPAACYNRNQCERAMQSMQNFHMDERGWWDIAYNFGVGSDGLAYEGRGWDILGAHSLNFNTVSIGICLIGDWTDDLPPEKQISTAKALIAKGVELGYVNENYTLVGHRQVKDTKCPGDALYTDIKTWDHYGKYPSSYLDVPDVLNSLSQFSISCSRTQL